MYQNILIEKLDYYGRGIAHLNNKIIFIPNALPNEIVDIEITKENKKYLEGKVIKYLKTSSKRITSKCPYFNKCGGCNLLYYKYEDTLNYKIIKIKELLEINKINYNKEIEIIKNNNDFYYRNKINLKIINNKIGFYEEKTHNLIEINNCIITKESINKVIKNYKLLNITNGNIIIRSNYNDEILLIIESNDKENINIENLKKEIKLIGIIYNNKLIYGENFFYERIGGYLFKVSYDAFFQVNSFINNELFKLINDFVDINSTVLDLYSGVGTLAIIASSKAQEVISVEIIKNAILDGIKNAKLNKRENIKFILGDTKKVINKLNKTFDTLIIDPPRSGIDKNTLNFINLTKPQKIIYISCNINSLIKNIKELKDYEITTYKLLDMFSYTYHIESFVVLKKAS